MELHHACHMVMMWLQQMGIVPPMTMAPMTMPPM